jgi:hypothetical protein
MEARVGATTPMSSMIYGTGARHLSSDASYYSLPHAARLLDLARVDTILSTAVLPLGKHGTSTLHIQSQQPSLLHTSQSPQVCAPAAAVLLLNEGASSCRR